MFDEEKLSKTQSAKRTPEPMTVEVYEGSNKIIRQFHPHIFYFRTKGDGP